MHPKAALGSVLNRFSRPRHAHAALAPGAQGQGDAVALGALAGVPGQARTGLRHVPFSNASRFEGRAEGAFHFRSEGDEQQPGGVLINAVDDAGARTPGFPFLPGLQCLMKAGGAGAIGKDGNASTFV